MKKIILSLGSIVAVSIPVVAVVSCGDDGVDHELVFKNGMSKEDIKTLLTKMDEYKEESKTKENLKIKFVIEFKDGTKFEKIFSRETSDTQDFEESLQKYLIENNITSI